MSAIVKDYGSVVREIRTDIISLGDMLVTNAPNTKFEFRLPSKGAPTLA